MRYLIWDFDGTLAYREGMWSGALLTVLKDELGHQIVEREEIAKFLRTGFPWHHPEREHSGLGTSADWWDRLDGVFVKAFVEGAGLEADQSYQLAKHVREVYPNLKYWRIYEDTVEGLETLSASGWRHVILSNHVPELRNIAAGLDLTRYFEGI